MGEAYQRKIDSIIDKMIEGKIEFSKKTIIEQDKDKSEMSLSISRAISGLNDAGQKLVLDELDNRVSREKMDFFDNNGNINTFELISITNAIVKETTENYQRIGIDLSNNSVTHRNNDLVTSVLTIALVNDMIKNYQNLTYVEERMLLDNYNKLSREQQREIDKKVNNKTRNFLESLPEEYKEDNEEKIGEVYKILEDTDKIDKLSELYEKKDKLVGKEKKEYEQLKDEYKEYFKPDGTLNYELLVDRKQNNNIKMSDSTRYLFLGKKKVEQGLTKEEEEEYEKLKKENFNKDLCYSLEQNSNSDAEKEINEIEKIIKDTEKKNRLVFLYEKKKKTSEEENEYQQLSEEFKEYFKSDERLDIELLNESKKNNKKEIDNYQRYMYLNIKKKKQSFTPEEENEYQQFRFKPDGTLEFIEQEYAINPKLCLDKKDKLELPIENELMQLPIALTKAEFSKGQIKEALRIYKKLLEGLSKDEINKNNDDILDTLYDKANEMELSESTEEVLGIILPLTYGDEYNPYSLKEILENKETRQQFFEQLDQSISQEIDISKPIQLTGELKEAIDDYLEDKEDKSFEEEQPTQLEQQLSPTINQESVRDELAAIPVALSNIEGIDRDDIRAGMQGYKQLLDSIDVSSLEGKSNEEVLNILMSKTSNIGLQGNANAILQMISQIGFSENGNKQIASILTESKEAFTALVDEASKEENIDKAIDESKLQQPITDREARPGMQALMVDLKVAKQNENKLGNQVVAKDESLFGTGTSSDSDTSTASDTSSNKKLTPQNMMSLLIARNTKISDVLEAQEETKEVAKEKDKKEKEGQEQESEEETK